MHAGQAIAVALLGLLVSGCAGQAPPPDRATDGTTTLATSLATGASPTASSPVADPDCDNAIGNGGEVVPGPSGPSGADRDNPFKSLAVHPTDGRTVYVGTERNGVLKTTDGGESWTRLRQGFRHGSEGYPEVYDIAIAPSDPDTLYAATTHGGPGPLKGDYPSTGGGVYKSTDGGLTWQRKTCGLSSGWVWSVWVDPADADRVLAGVSGGAVSFYGGDVRQGQYFDGGVFRSTDGGERWTRTSIGPLDNRSSYLLILAPDDEPGLVYTFGGNFKDDDAHAGFARSQDGGASWTRFAPDLQKVGAFGVSADGRVLYAAHDSYNEILVSENAGATWRSFPIHTSIYGLAVSPADASRVAFATTDTLLVSTDGLLTSRVARPGMPERATDIAFAASDPSVAYAITQGYSFFKSVEGGEGWTLVKDLRADVLNAQP